MRQGVLKTYDLNPDGVRIVIGWDDMVVGASVFIPCVNTEDTIKQAKKIAEVKVWKIEHQVRIEDGKLGVRIWRIL